MAAEDTLGLSPISTGMIDMDALKVVRRLQRFGHKAYLVGGCVRDLLLDLLPKDFDVATSATPDEVRKIFRNCRIIGRRFRLAHIYFQGKIIETSTFRAPPEMDPEAEGEERIIWRDNIFGTAEEDAFRRDFTMNGLFYYPLAREVIDFVGGQQDLKKRRVKTIGDPRLRFQEDPVRILRAIKFAARLKLAIEPTTLEAMVEFRGMIAKCSVSRVLEELYRLMETGNAKPSFQLMHRTGVLAVLLPEINSLLPPPENPLASASAPAVLWNPDGSGRQSRGRRDPAPALAEEERVRAEEERDHRAMNACSATVDALLDHLFQGEPMLREKAGSWLFNMLDSVDQANLHREERLPRSFLLAAALSPLIVRALNQDMEIREALSLVDELVETISARICVSRKDRQEIRLLLSAQRRMVIRGKRTRPKALMKRKYFEAAFQLLGLLTKATGLHRDAFSYWQRLREHPPKNKQDRPKRRRRRPRPPRHPKD